MLVWHDEQPALRASCPSSACSSSCISALMQLSFAAPSCDACCPCQYSMQPLQPATTAAVYLPLLILQVLQGMPIIAAPPRAVETAPAPVPGPAPPAEGAIAELTVPSQALLLPLQPSKLTVYRLFADQVCFCWQGRLHCCYCCRCWLCLNGSAGSDVFCVLQQQKQC